MQTRFTESQLIDPAIREADGILRACVHCGFCTATCPTFVLLGDETDSPRGRIMLIKEMLEQDRPASTSVVTHIDRCLTCLSCMSTCPSGVDYLHLVDHARTHIAETHRRPLADRMLRRLICLVLPYTGRFRVAMRLARLIKPLAAWAPGRLRGMLERAPAASPAPGPASLPGRFAATGQRKMRVAMLTGCVQPVLRSDVNDATVRLLTRLGAEVVVAPQQGCCGALSHHMGDGDAARRFAIANLQAWQRERDGDGLDAIVINASGCGSTVKDYAHLLAGDATWGPSARQLASMCRDVTEIVEQLGYAEAVAKASPTAPLTVAYHASCSLQHGQRIRDLPKVLLRQAGFTVVEPTDSHLCCGAAGSYTLLQPTLAGQLQERKVASLAALAPDVIAAGNIGCLTQIDETAPVAVVHTVELLDWAAGGPKPRGL